MRPAHRACLPCRGPCRHLPPRIVLDHLSAVTGLVGDLHRFVESRFGPSRRSAAVAAIVACPVRGRAIAAAYQAGPAWDVAALPAYHAFRDETARQFELLTGPAGRGGLGIAVEVSVEDTYPHAAAMAADLDSSWRLRVYGTGGRGNSHPLLTADQNDMFRAVHDVFGHVTSGRGFDRHGEDAAWLAHSRMYSPLARLAMTSETRGQTSSFVWHHRGERFPDQKLMLLPPGFCDPAQVSVRAG